MYRGNTRHWPRHRVPSRISTYFFIPPLFAHIHFAPAKYALLYPLIYFCACFSLRAPWYICSSYKRPRLSLGNNFLDGGKCRPSSVTRKKDHPLLPVFFSCLDVVNIDCLQIECEQITVCVSTIVNGQLG